MVDFRRMIPVLAVIAFLLGSAVTASAQANQPFSCFATGGVSTPARSEDITALVGDMVLNCVGGIATAFGAPIPQVNIQVFLNTSLTSRLISTSAPCNIGSGCSEALLLLDEPAPLNQFACAAPSAQPGAGTTCNGYGNGAGSTTAGYYGSGTVGLSGTINCTANPAPTTGCVPGANKNVFQAVQTTSNSVTFIGVPIDPPGTSGSRVVRITNVRGNANALGVAGANATPTPIVETISPNPPQFLPVNNPSQTVAFIQRGLAFSIQAATCTTSGSTVTCSPGSAITTGTLQQCDNSRATSTSTNFNKALGFLRYTEQFATAFRNRFTTDNQNACGSGATGCASGGAGAAGAAPQQNILSNAPNFTPYNTESGFVNTALIYPSGRGGGEPGLADFGTRVKAVFNNIPNGVNIFVDTISKPPQTTAGPDWAQLTSLESGAYSAVSGSSSNPNGSAQLTVTNGSATAVWEVLLSDPNTFAQLNFGFYASYTANPGSNSPALATTTVNGSYAPTSTITVASTNSVPVPRFADTSTATNVFTVVPCLTTLLFPYLTNAAGFDTGVAISATATDPFGTTPQSGTCTLNWYGAAFTGATPTPNIPSGTTYSTLVSTTLNNVTGGFTGYMIAVCRFQYAHGFAFVSDLGARNLAMGYLALIIPDPTSSTAGRLATPGTCGGANDVAGPLAGCLSTGEALHQ
jgi:hypothetical protein